MADKSKKAIGVLLLNLGGPDSLQAIRPFLYNLFSDREIIRLGPSFLQKPVAWLISSLRSKKTEKMYSLIGGKSPILAITKAQAQALEKALNQKSEVPEKPWSPLAPPEAGKLRHGAGRSQKSNPPLPPFNKGGMGGIFKVYIGMRYWRPFIKDAVQEVLKDRIKHLIVLSLYPHYSKATTGSSISEFKRVISGVRDQGFEVKIQYIEHWFDFPPYIDSLAEHISNGISDFDSEPAYRLPALRVVDRQAGTGRPSYPVGRPVELLYSAHSVPEAFIKEGDPYLKHIKATITAINSSLVTTRLSSPKSRHLSLVRWHLSFQSKSGPVRWLQPSTNEAIIKLAETGCKNLLVVPISFVSDHIETLYEIDILYKGLAEKHGINLKRCQSLNTSEEFITALKELVLMKIKEKG